MAATMLTRTTIVCLAFLFLRFLIPLLAVHGGGSSSDDDDHGDVKPNLRTKSLILLKIWCLIIVFIATFAGGVSPFFFRWNQTFLSLGTQFAGGVFLGTALMHFLSDSAEMFSDLTEKEYPFAFILCTAGYLLTMLGELVVTWVFAKQSNKTGMASVPLEPKDDEGQFPAHTGDTTFRYQEAKAPLSSSAFVGDRLLLTLALCFHSVFEGIAIGVAETKAEAWRALWTVSLHKIFAAIAIGIALLEIIPNRPLLSFASYSFAFAISSPIGIAIGILIDATQGRVADWIYAISMGFASGVFIYVAINHLLNHHNSQRDEIAFDTPFYNCMAVVLGGGVIAVVMIWD